MNKFVDIANKIKSVYDNYQFMTRFDNNTLYVEFEVNEYFIQSRFNFNKKEIHLSFDDQFNVTFDSDFDYDKETNKQVFNDKTVIFENNVEDDTTKEIILQSFRIIFSYVDDLFLSRRLNNEKLNATIQSTLDNFIENFVSGSINYTVLDDNISHILYFVTDPSMLINLMKMCNIIDFNVNSDYDGDISSSSDESNDE